MVSFCIGPALSLSLSPTPMVSGLPAGAALSLSRTIGQYLTQAGGLAGETIGSESEAWRSESSDYSAR